MIFDYNNRDLGNQYLRDLSENGWSSSVIRDAKQNAMGKSIWDATTCYAGRAGGASAKTNARKKTGAAKKTANGTSLSNKGSKTNLYGRPIIDSKLYKLDNGMLYEISLQKIIPETKTSKETWCYLHSYYDANGNLIDAEKAKAALGIKDSEELCEPFPDGRIVFKGNGKEISAPATKEQKQVVNDIDTRTDKAKKEFNEQLDKQGFAGEFADLVKSLFGSDNTEDKVNADIEITDEQVKELREALKKGEAAFKAKFKEIFGREFNLENIQKFKEIETIYEQTCEAKAQEDLFKSTHNLLLSGKPLSGEKGRRDANGEFFYTVTEKQVYKREFDKLAATLGNNGASVLNQLIKQSVGENASLDKKYQVLQSFAKITADNLSQTTFNCAGKRSFEEITELYDSTYHRAFGDNNILKRVREYNESQQKGAGIVKMVAVTAATIAAGFISGGMAVPIVAGLSTGAVEVADTATSRQNRKILSDKGLVEWLKATNEQTDWKSVTMASMQAGVMTVMFMGQSMVVTNLMLQSGKSATSAIIADLVAGSATGAGVEYLMTGEISIEGQIFSVGLSIVGGAIAVKSIKPSNQGTYTASGSTKKQAAETNVTGNRDVEYKYEKVGDEVNYPNASIAKNKKSVNKNKNAKYDNTPTVKRGTWTTTDDTTVPKTEMASSREVEFVYNTPKDNTTIYNGKPEKPSMGLYGEQTTATTTGKTQKPETEIAGNNTAQKETQSQQNASDDFEIDFSKFNGSYREPLEILYKQNPELVKHLVSQTNPDGSLRFDSFEIIMIAASYEKYPNAVDALLAKTNPDGSPKLYGHAVRDLAEAYTNYPKAVDELLLKTNLDGSQKFRASEIKDLAETYTNHPKAVDELSNLDSNLSVESIRNVAEIYSKNPDYVKNKVQTRKRNETLDFADPDKVSKVAKEKNVNERKLLEVAEKTNKSDSDIEILAEYMQKNPGEADVIADVAISNPNVEGKADLDTFLNLIKKYPDNKTIISELAKNPNLNMNNVENYIYASKNRFKNDPDYLSDVQFLSSKRYSEGDINNYIALTRRHPELRDTVFSEAPSYKLIDDNPTTLEIRNKRSSIETHLNEVAPDELARLRQTLGDEFYPDIKWEDIIPPNATQAEIKTILKTLNDESKFFARTKLNEQRYGKNIQWAHEMNTISEVAVCEISKGKSFRDVITHIAENYGAYDRSGAIDDSRQTSGIYRGGTRYPGEYAAMTPFNNTDCYVEYYDRFTAIANKKRTAPYPDMELTQIFKYGDDSGTMYHPQVKTVDAAMKHVEDRYNALLPLIEKVQNGGTLQRKELAFANKQISEMYFMLANAMPYERGSNGISDIFMRSVYKSLKIEQPALKSGVSLDLEAFCYDMKTFTKKWDSFFEKP